MEVADVTAVVVAHDSAEVLAACLAALRSAGIRTLVVDNASRDGSREVAKAAGSMVVALARNEGYGRANNRGVAAAETPLVLVCNPDIVLDAGAVPALSTAAAGDPDAVLFAPRIVEMDGRFFFQPRSLLAPGRTDTALPSGDCCPPFLSGACLLVRREAFLAVGGFDENIFLFYEDDDLCRRLVGARHALVHVHDAVARHVRGGSSAPAPGRFFTSRWHQAWSRAYVSAKYGLPSPALRMLLVNGLKALGAALLFRRALVERYAGSAAGAFAYLRGRTALAHQGLVSTSSADPREASGGCARPRADAA